MKLPESIVGLCPKLSNRRMVRDGEVLIRHIRNAENHSGSTQFLNRFLDEEYCTTNHDNGNRIVMGVELNRFNKPEAFWIFQGPDHPYDDFSYGVNKPGRIRVPASDMLHIYLPERSHQSRGVPMFACVMKALHQLDGYMEAELIAARLHSKSLF